MKQVLLLTLICLFYKPQAQSNEITTSDKLESFIGAWKGEGWHKHPDHTNYFIQTCKIMPKLDGKLLLVEQKTHIKGDPKDVIFEELSIWRYDQESDRILVTSFKGSGMRESVLQFSDNRIIAKRNEHIQFITAIDPQGRYVMKGTNQDQIF